VQEGKVDAGFPLRVRDAQKPIYVRLIDEIDILMGFKAGRELHPPSPIRIAECA
jgi:hypothetical protein